MNNDDYRQNHSGDEQYPYSSYYEGSSYTFNDGKKKKKHSAGPVFLLSLVLIVASAAVMLRRYDFQLDRDPESGSWSFSMSDSHGQTSVEASTPQSQPDSSTASSGHSSQMIAAPTGDGTVMNITGLNSSAQELTLQEIYKKVAPSVVGVSCSTGSSSSTGTGIIMSEDGYIITNYHVIDDSVSITVELNAGDQYKASLVGGDETSDLAVIKIDVHSLPAAEFGDDQQLEVGDEVAAIGNPLGLELKGTLTNGIVSAINRDITMNGRSMTLIQTNAALNAGNSGGPLINNYGQVVGINTMKLSSYLSSVEGLGFAIPISLAKPIVDELISQGYVTGRPAIGITGQDVTSRASLYYRIPGGVMIKSVQPGTDAEAKGIMAGDIITAANGTAVSTMDELNAIKAGFVAGDIITLTIYRSGEVFDIDVALVDAATLEN